MNCFLKGLLFALAGCLVAVTAHAESILALTGGSVLLRVDSAAPSVILASVNVTGLQPAETLHAIDVRPANGRLFGLGSTSRLYAINPATGVASAVGS